VASTVVGEGGARSCATSPCRAGLGILWPPARPTLGVTPVRSASRVAAARQSISCRGLDVV
jgi:hypothetical protein